MGEISSTARWLKETSAVEKVMVAAAFLVLIGVVGLSLAELLG